MLDGIITHHMKRKRHIIVFGGLILVTAAVFAYAFVFRSFAGTFIGDSGDPSDRAILDQLDRTLSPEQWAFFRMSLERVSSVYLAFLVITNAIWIIGTYYFLKRLRKDDHAT